MQGLPVIAMELAPGGTLKDLLVDGQPLAPPAAVDAILQVIAGLHEAAALGILHRDIKPSNCFVDRDGRILVGDFGLSITTLAREPGDTGRHGHDPRHARLCLARAASRGTRSTCAPTSTRSARRSTTC